MKICSERHSQGQVIVLAALLLTVLIGFVGLAADTGYFFDYKRRMTTAVDSAALAGALEVQRDPAGTNVVTVARQAAEDNGFKNSTNNITVTVNRPPTSGYNMGNSNYVEVLINRPQPTFFLRALNIATTTVSARAVAGAGTASDCIYVLDPVADNAFLVQGSSVVDTPSCNVYVNSVSSTAMNAFGSGTACVHAASIRITGQYTGCATTTTTPIPQTLVPPVTDPFATLQPPAVPTVVAASTHLKTGAGSRTLSPGLYKAGIEITTGSIITLNPGLYYIQVLKPTTDYALRVSGAASVTGTGVMIYIAGGTVDMRGTGSTVIQAATRNGGVSGTDGTLEGVVFFQNRTDILPATFVGGSDTRIDGVMYFPTALVQYRGGAVDIGYTVMVAKRLTLTGNTSFNADYSSLANGSPVKKGILSE